MRVHLVCPAGSIGGNRTTAARWATRLRELGHQATIADNWRGQTCDLFVALHARRSAAAVATYRRARPHGRLILALTGTDLYRDLPANAAAQASLAAADRLIVLQPLAIVALPEAMRGKTRVIVQSAEPAQAVGGTANNGFEVCVLAHLRAVKDPLRVALAARRLPAASRLRVVHAGAAMSEAWAAAARAEERRNPRYRWLGALERPAAAALLAGAHALILPSRLEGGANVVGEAIVAGVPVLASRIPGSVGLLGERYGGYFPVGDTASLAALLDRIERDAAFLGELRAWCRRLQPLFAPERERAAWQALLAELA